MATPKIGDETTLKITKVNATYGREDWQNRSAGQMQWIHDGRKDFYLFHYLTSGRGWVRMSDPIVLRDGSADIHVKVLDVDDNRGVAFVQVLDGFDLRTLEYKKRPYVRKDGTVSPQVVILYSHRDDWSDPNVPEESIFGSRKLSELYGMFDYRDTPVEEVREIFAGCGNPDKWVQGCMMSISLKDLNEV